MSVGLAFRRARLQYVYSILRGKDLETEKFSPERRVEQFDVLKKAQAQVLNLQNWHNFLKALVLAGYRSEKMISSQSNMLYTYVFYLIGRTEYGVEEYTLPGVYCLRTNELNWDESTLWKTYTMLTDLEAVFRCPKSELGLRPIYHHTEERAEGHLFITVLAYQAVQAIRRKLGSHGIHESWACLRKIFAGQQRVTATFRQKDGKTLHVRKATVAEPKLNKLYDLLAVSASPGGIRKMIK